MTRRSAIVGGIAAVAAIAVILRLPANAQGAHAPDATHGSDIVTRGTSAGTPPALSFRSEEASAGGMGPELGPVCRISSIAPLATKSVSASQVAFGLSKRPVKLAVFNDVVQLVDWLAELSRRKVVCRRQRIPLVGFQGNLLGQHDVARDEMIVRHEAPARSRQAGIVQLEDVRSLAGAYPVSVAGVTAGDLEIFVRVILRQLLLRKPFSQELEAAQLACAGALVPIVKGSRQVSAGR